MSNKKLLKFGAAWCGPCKFQDKILEEIKEEHPELDITLINVDSEDGEILAEKHGVKNTPAIIIFDEDGDEQERFVGITQKKVLLEAMSCAEKEEPKEE